MHWQERREKETAQPDDVRDAAGVDYARVIHSASFRRLQGKTQILNLGDGDFYRTRLTHSLEVAQVAGGIAEHLRKRHAGGGEASHLPGLSMVQTMGAVHDLGHPPFGHGGEVALNYCMRSDGGFEGNGQTLRILARLEKYSATAGANLTRRTLLGVLKYPVPYSEVFNAERMPALAEGPTVERILDRRVSKPPKCYLDSEKDVVEWIISPFEANDRALLQSVSPVAGGHGRALHKSLDCSIMDLADDISFGVHDLEDAVTLGLLPEDAFREIVTIGQCAPFAAWLTECHGNEFGEGDDGFVACLFGRNGTPKRLIGRMVNYLISGSSLAANAMFADPFLRYQARLSEDRQLLLDGLKQVVMRHVILGAPVQQLEFKGQQMVLSVFDALSSDPEALLPAKTQGRYRAADAAQKRRVICDHVAGMTDGFLVRTYERLFSPRMGSVFDRI